MNNNCGVTFSWSDQTYDIYVLFVVISLPWQISNLYFIQAFLQEKGLSIPGELVLKFGSRWVDYDLSSREECFLNLLYCVNWNNVDAAFIVRLLEEDKLYHNSQDALYNLLSVRLKAIEFI